MPRITSLTSAPTASQRLARALTKLSLVARKALEAYLMSSADDGVVITTGALVLLEQPGHPERGRLRRRCR